jgi:uncharacterized protein with HEPN domain
VSRSWRLFLLDMLQAARKVERYTTGLDLEALLHNEMALDATLRNLEILGEAAKGVPPDVQARYPEVDWRGIAGLRDVLAHAYFALDSATLWDIVRRKVPPLVAQLAHIERGTR